MYEDVLTVGLEVTDLEAARARRGAKGLHPTEIRDHPWGARVFYVSDPEGRRLEVWQSAPEV